MTVQMLMSMMLFSAAALALQVRFATAGEPVKALAVQRSTPAFDHITRSETGPVLRAGAAFDTKARGAGVVSSAMSPLDLGVLSLADFGDVEPTR
jgi:hypothetical protein